MNYKRTELPNGVRLIVVPMANMASATVTIWVNVGSRYETPKVNGISHFLEHMVFKGSLRRPSAKLIAEAIDSFGGEFNASTSKDWTNFYIKARSAKLDIAFDVLSDMVLHPLLKSEDIEREKGVIAEEISMYDDTPMAKIGDIFENLIFKGSSLAADIVGTKDIIRKISKDDFERYRKKYYGANNIVVTVSGGVKLSNVEKLAGLYMSDLGSKTKNDYRKYNSVQKRPQVLLKRKKNEQAHLILGFRGLKRGHKDRYILGVLATILGSGMSSRLFTEVREKRGLAYSVRSSASFYSDTGYHDTYAGIDVNRVDEAIKVMLDQHYQLASGKNKISKKELTKAKEYLKGHLALGLEDTKAVNGFFGKGELKLGKIETPEEVYKAVDKVSIDEILKVAKRLFKPAGLNLALIGPYKEQKRFEKLLH